MVRPKVGEARREAILAAFEACVVRKGFAETTLADVAEAAGQPRPLVRYFIGNRADMVGALIDRLLERGEAHLDALKAMDGGGDLETTLDLLWARVFEDATTNVVTMELWHLSLRDEALRARLAAIYRRMIFEIVGLLAPGGDRLAEVEDRVFASVSMAFGAAFFRHLGLAPPSPERLRALARELLTAARSDAPFQSGVTP
ncbi:MAG: TetR family transcriptional regulator [Phenylobacterium sp.]|uniref:TetR/AcrR family transcriptional regulator n=1 Tax=Phenylobacterium sp. TaxID=1871053 RepID=UPI0025D0C8B4|nr:TetR/AcrR family transcriptional regulator [Phenylobacterium sp.]MBI1199070.1 TetR family transcriptional regulator [Phenylobacterium sp.]